MSEPSIIDIREYTRMTLEILGGGGATQRKTGLLASQELERTR